MADNGSNNLGLREKLIREHDKAKKEGDDSRLSDIRKQMQSMPGLKFPPEYLQDLEEINGEPPEFGRPSNIAPIAPNPDDKKSNNVKALQNTIATDQEELPRAIDSTPIGKANAEPEAEKKQSFFDQVKSRVPGFNKKNSQDDEGDEKNVAVKAEGTKEGAKDLKNAAKIAAEAASGNYLSAAYNAFKSGLVKKYGKKGLYLFLAIPILIFITSTIFFIVSLGMFNGNVSSLTGGTMTKATNPISDRKWIEKVLGLSGDQVIGSKQSASLLTGLSSDIGNFKTQTTDPNTLAQLETITADISAVQSSKASADAVKLVSDLKTLIKSTANPMPHFTSTTRAPLDNITDYNQSLFGGTPQNKTTTKGVPETYTQTGKGTCDAVKLYADGQPLVYPLFAGKITAITDDGTSQAKEIIIQSTDGNYDVLYAHLSKITKSVGATVVTSEAIGNIYDAYIQMEVSYKGQCVVTSLADKIDMSNPSPTYPKKGQYLWQNIKTIFNLQ